MTPSSTLAQDLVDDIALGKKVIAAWRTGGKTAALALLPEVATAVQKDISDTTAALPDIKAGYKTTEFWLVAGAVLLNGIFPAVTGKPLPIDANVAITAAVGLYTIVRGLLKKPAAPAPALTPAGAVSTLQRVPDSAPPASSLQPPA